mmetsp:Transcript_23790/g.82711  ORF Transcript_23790/g.82711 Transcript_23790/m.82711 type:complete len:237 (+) Transcript_23790:480-1190(+)
MQAALALARARGRLGRLGVELHAHAGERALREAAAEDGGEDDDAECCGHDHVVVPAAVVVRVDAVRHIQRQREGDGATEAGEPDDVLHLLGDGALALEVCEVGDGEGVERSADQAEDDGEDDERGVPGRELAGEEAHAHVGEDDVLRDHGERLEDVRGADLRLAREVVPVVVGQHDAAEEEGHDARQADALAHGVRRVREQEEDGDLLVRVLAQVRVLAHGGAGQAEDDADEDGAD